MFVIPDANASFFSSFAYTRPKLSLRPRMNLRVEISTPTGPTRRPRPDYILGTACGTENAEVVPAASVAVAVT